VAFEASADDRDTRGFISIATMRPSAGIDRELNVRAARLDADAADDAAAHVPHPLVFLVGERQRRRDRDRIASVDAHRIDVLDRADDDEVVGDIRITSSSNSFQPMTDSSTRISCTG
jgi:hypothetical protein